MQINDAEKHRIDIIAQICHNVNKAYCESIGEDNIVSWYKASEDVKESVRIGVKEVIQDSHIMPEEIHDKWVQYKKKQGWKFGKVKDADKKTHPDLVPYNKLPVEQKAKDYIFIALVRQVKQLL